MRTKRPPKGKGRRKNRYLDPDFDSDEDDFVLVEKSSYYDDGLGERRSKNSRPLAYDTIEPIESKRLVLRTRAAKQLFCFFL